MPSVRPAHHHEPADDAGQVPRRDVAPECRHGAEEDCAVPEVEFGAREAHVEEVEEEGDEGPEEEAVGEGPVDCFGEETFGALGGC